jgi:hypothetical protein
MGSRNRDHPARIFEEDRKILDMTDAVIQTERLVQVTLKLCLISTPCLLLRKRTIPDERPPLVGEI